MRMLPATHAKAKAIASLRGISLTALIEENAVALYEDLEEDERRIVDLLVESQSKKTKS